MLASHLFKYYLLIIYSLSIAYTHLRGKTRLKFLRQLTDHTSLLAPINGFMYLFSAVPRTAFLKLDSFPELETLKHNWLLIREEAQQLYDQGYIGSSEQYDDIGFNSFFRRGWKRFYLKWYQDPPNSALSLCPKTTALIQQIPSINAAMFALLPKQSFLYPHRDPYAGSLRYHLGLITPNSEHCCIYIDGHKYFWRDGEAVMFDETFIHSAENNTDQDRIILFCDIKRPLKYRFANAFNHLFSNTVMRASGSKNLPNEQVGIINKIFKYIYQIRLIGKKLKNYDRKLYYFVKYTLFAGLIYLILF